MKPIKNQATSIAGFKGLSTESKLCFGAAGGCFLLGSIGVAINALSTTPTTLSAFLVVSAFYLLLGVISLFKRKLDDQVEEPSGIVGMRSANSIEDDEMDEAAA